MALSQVEDRRVAPLMQKFLANQKAKKTLKAGVDLLRMRATELKEHESVQALIGLVQADN